MIILFHTLPLDIIYRILDHLHDQDLFLSARNVCQRLNIILDSYQRFNVIILTFQNNSCFCFHRHLQNSTFGLEIFLLKLLDVLVKY